MPNFRERIAYRSYRAWRFLCLNWRDLVAIGIGLIGIVGVLSGVYLVFTTPFSGLTVVYVVLIFASAVVTYNGLGRYDYLLLDKDD